MGKAAPVKVSNSEAAPETAPAQERIDRAAARKANSVPFSQRDSASFNPEIDVMKGLSQRYGVPIDRLQYYRSLHFGYEEIVPALVVGKSAQAEVGRVLQLRMKGQSWQTIAGSFYIDFKPLNAEVQEILKPIRERLPKRALDEHPVNQTVK
jgi:hypothetical protein